MLRDNPLTLDFIRSARLYLTQRPTSIVGLLNWERIVATQPAATPESSKKEGKKKSLLKREVPTSGKGRLGKKVRAPKWLRAFGGYFAGAWRELREVRWPTRRATWGLTLAVILFSVALVVFILALDFGFEQLFKKVIL